MLLIAVLFALYISGFFRNYDRIQAGLSYEDEILYDTTLNLKDIQMCQNML